MIEYRPSQGQFTEQQGWAVVAQPTENFVSPIVVPTEKTVTTKRSALETQSEAISNSPLKEFHRDRSLTNFAPVELIPLGRNGDRQTGSREPKPPRNRPFVVAVDHSNGYVGVGYEKGEMAMQGYHQGPDNYMRRLVLARRRREADTGEPRKGRFVVLHGATATEKQPKHVNGEKAKRVVEIFAMHPSDIIKEGGEKEKLRQLDAIDRPWEKGEVVPQDYVGEFLAQRLMAALDVDELRVVYARPAHHIYQSGTRKPLPRQFREGD